MKLKLVDTTSHWTSSQSYGRTSTYVIGDRDLVRVEVYVDSYEKQSYARARVMTDAGWQPLAEVPASSWFGSVPSYANKHTELARTAALNLETELAKRAQTIITAWKGAAA